MVVDEKNLLVTNSLSAFRDINKTITKHVHKNSSVIDTNNSISNIQKRDKSAIPVQQPVQSNASCSNDGDKLFLESPQFPIDLSQITKRNRRTAKRRKLIKRNSAENLPSNPIIPNAVKREHSAIAMSSEIPESTKYGYVPITKKSTIDPGLSKIPCKTFSEVSELLRSTLSYVST